MKLMSWTLRRPSNSTFEKFADLVEGQPWYSPLYQIKNENAMKDWSAGNRSFMEILEKHQSKFYAMGMHEFEINYGGEVLDMQWSSRSDYRTDPKYRVLTDNLLDIRGANYVQKSLRYAMHRYPNIKWAVQFLATSNSSGDRVTPILDNINGAQDTFIKHCKAIATIYQRYFPMVKTVEIDMEKTTSRTNVNGRHEAYVFRDLLVRVKNEVCIPLGMELRVNLYAMTGDFNPSYYGWHDYATVASGVDKNGNQAIDEFQLMSYDFSWGGSAPGSSTPLWWLKNIMEHVKKVLPPHKTFIGNAGYGRRWSLGEWSWDSNGQPIVHTLRQGGTLDYKQLMQVQNGMFIHNMGTTVNGQFQFFDQDFIPFCGFNDDESDYQKTFIHVYDRFAMTSNGGAVFNNINRPSGASYITKYSTEQYGVFTGVYKTIIEATSTVGAVNSIQTINTPPNEGVSTSLAWRGYSITTVKDGNSSAVTPKIKYDFSITSGTYRLIALVNFPFYNSADFTISLNGTNKRIYIKDDWYPMMLVQRKHFYDCGEVNLNSNNAIEINFTGGAQIFGFIICKDYSSTMVGGSVQMPTYLKPMKRIAKQNMKGDVEIVNAQFPSKMRIVGEILRRPPRPSIIWEDMFGSHINNTDDNIDVTSLIYYSTTSKGGYSKGSWKVYPASPSDNAHVLANSTNGHCQLVLNKTFTTNTYTELQYKVTGNNVKYGVKLGINKAESDKDGYLIIADHATRKFKVIKEVNGIQTEIKSTNMSNSFHDGRSNFRTMKVTCLNGRVSLFVGDTCYLKEVDIGTGHGAIGAYIANGSMKLMKYHIGSLDRWERMERLKLEVEGINQVQYFGEIERTCKVDEFGLLVFTGYPDTMDSTFPNRTIISTQTNTKYDWNADYRNLPLGVVDSWQGKKNIKITMLDAGIWIQTVYIGDNEGMSVAYNSDRVGFCKTVDFIFDYKCKGIAMWTLGQEDPMIYSYLH